MNSMDEVRNEQILEAKLRQEHGDPPRLDMEIENIKEILKTNLPIRALDVNSKFEDSPGLKNIKNLKNFTSQLTSLLERRD